MMQTLQGIETAVVVAFVSEFRRFPQGHWGPCDMGTCYHDTNWSDLGAPEEPADVGVVNTSIGAKNTWIRKSGGSD